MRILSISLVSPLVLMVVTTCLMSVSAIVTSPAQVSSQAGAEGRALAPVSVSGERQPRSLFSLFFDGFRNIHDKLHDKDTGDKEKVKDADDDKASDVKLSEEEQRGTEETVLVRSGCETKFVLVETVHYTESITRECVTRNVTQCHAEDVTECRNVTRDECRQSRGRECYDKYEEECDTRYREEVSNEESRECDQDCQYRWEGEGNDKRWVVDESTCSCGQVTRETRVQVPFLDCRLAKRKECRTVPVTQCRKVPDQECVTRSEDVCEAVPQTRCGDIHRRVPHTLQRRKPVQVCGGEPGEHQFVIEA